MIGTARQGGRVLVVLWLLAALSVVSGTNARPASAYVGEAKIASLSKAVPKIARGVVTGRGELVAGAFLAGFYGSTYALNYLFPQDPAQTATLGASSYSTITNAGGAWDAEATLANPRVFTLQSHTPANLQVYVTCWASAYSYTGNVNQGFISIDGAAYSDSPWASVTYGGPAVHSVRAVCNNAGELVKALTVRGNGQGELGYGNTSIYQANPPALVQQTTKTHCRNSSGTLATGVAAGVRWLQGIGQAPPAASVSDCNVVMPGSSSVVVTGVEVTNCHVTYTDRGCSTDFDAKTFSPTAEVEYPACAGASAAGCELRVERQTTPGVWTNCRTMAEGSCVKWAANPDYRCMWGAYTLAKGECTEVFGQAFEPPPEPAPQPGTTTTPGAEPGSTTTTVVERLPDGRTRRTETTTNPDGSKTITVTTWNPDGTPATEVPPVKVPAPGNGTSPPAEQGECVGASFTLNPVDWVLEPVKCALRWAFFITPATQAKWASAGDLAQAKPPVSLVNGAASFAAPFGSIGQTCPQWNVKVAGSTRSIVCGQGYTERLHDWRDLTGAALLALAVMPFLWRIWHAGLPILNVSPHR